MPQYLEDLILNEAFSNYVIFFAGVVTTAIGWLILRWIARKKPSIITVEKLYASSLIDVDDDIKEKVKITYEDKPIEGFHEARFMIRNTGETPIQDIELIFTIDGFSTYEFSEVTFTNAERIEKYTTEKPLVSEKEVGEAADDPDVFLVTLPFLNPEKVYDDYLGITIYAPKPVTIKGVIGKGLGWTTRYIDKTEYYDRAIKIVSTTTGNIVFGSIFRVLRWF